MYIYVCGRVWMGGWVGMCGYVYVHVSNLVISLPYHIGHVAPAAVICNQPN